MHVINSLMPVFLLIALGAVLQAGGFFRPGFMPELNRLIYWLGIPCLVFVKVATAQQDLAPAMRLVPVFLMATVLIILVSYVLSFLFRVPQGSIGAFVQAGFRGNLVFVALPILVFSAAANSVEHSEQIATLAILVISPIFVLYNFAAVLVLVADSPEGTPRPTAGQMAREVITNPLIIAALLGGAWLWTGWTLLPGLERSLNALGQIALPLALLGVGTTLRTVRFGGSIWFAFLGASLKVIMLPVIGYLLALWAGLEGIEMQILLIFCCAPGAVAGYVMADRLRGDTGLAAASIVLSTLLSLPVYVIVLIWTGESG